MIQSTNNAQHNDNITHDHTTAPEGQDNSQTKGEGKVDKNNHKQNTH